MHRGTCFRARVLVACGTTWAAVLMLGIGPAAAAGAVVVSGDQSAPVATCDGLGSLGTFVMSGDLIGCWYTDTGDVVSTSQNGIVFAGTEHFVGCLDADGNGVCGGSEPTGSFNTTFKFTAKFSTVGEVHGRCHHPIVGGTGDFAVASGDISFHDVIDGTVVTATYSGPISH